MKRPTKKTLNSTDSHAVNAAILAARSRLKQQHSSATQAAHRSPEDFLEKKPAAAIASASASARGGRLSHLLNRVGVTNCELKNTQGKSRTSWEEEEDRNGTALDMDDYYKNLREWDFLSDWDRGRGGGNGGGNGNGNAANSAAAKKRSANGAARNKRNGDDGSMVKMIPNTFSSRRQYQKLWAPLCLAEARAQFISDASGNLPWRSNPNNNGNGGGGGRRGRNDNTGPVPVMVKASMKDVGANVDAMTVVTSPKDGNMGPSFSSGDFVVLACSESIFVKASRGRLFSDYKHNGQEEDSVNSPTRVLYGASGHVEFSRRTTDGLKVRISRQQWIKLCRGKKVESMFLLKVGGNVTSMREFTALSRVNSLAMLPYVLCRKMTRAKDNLDRLTDVICGAPESKSQKKSNHLKNMGGTAALGEGFAKYASKKFNDSQLGAISAAASEYGSGGFTLVKGPPGKLCPCRMHDLLQIISAYNNTTSFRDW
jgi:senataxin